ncbi:hypothetical protein TEA_003874 [Camellia sinensis var. sinensis]|uniref:Uncharacterized protein n=1 Tax=Camellia sinensis var. sinensis TaxID=542762 RepID=A0A4S4EV17_CAMSN|nr:hypothetical protein TEA_003874 [Camellia sinensis var. sinensis]
MNVTQALNNRKSLLLSFFSPTMVTLKASYMVKPAKETPTRLMYLSEFDQFDTITHSPTVYFYQQSGELILNAIIHTLKDSLSKALIMFYPLAGRLQWIARGRLQYGHSMKCGGKSGKWSILYWKDSSLADSNRMNWVVPVLTKEPAGSNKMNNNAHVSNVDKPKGFIEAESSQKVAFFIATFSGGVDFSVFCNAGKLLFNQMQNSEEQNWGQATRANAWPASLEPTCFISGWARARSGLIEMNEDSVLTTSFESKDWHQTGLLPKPGCGWPRFGHSFGIGGGIQWIVSDSIDGLMKGCDGVRVKKLEKELWRAIPNIAASLFLETESEAKIDDFGDFCLSSKTRALIPSVDYDRPIHELPLLLVQLTSSPSGPESLTAKNQRTSHFLIEQSYNLRILCQKQALISRISTHHRS